MRNASGRAKSFPVVPSRSGNHVDSPFVPEGNGVDGNDSTRNAERLTGTSGGTAQSDVRAPDLDASRTSGNASESATSGQGPITRNGWAVAQGVTRPIAEVLAEQKRKRHAQDKRTREAAFRERAALIAQLEMCLCCYPLKTASTPSGHEEWCPGELLRISREQAKGNANG